ncbi:iron chaperone [Hufsiella ginkgonis]|uniref:DUF1801 domain-containing protein n=1 Tax=Hufsiella ginkgonis TaxID=2695274 RepID=A0A7K1XTX0_9SPHI|nr:DUF1801 domain-containing protein [Hufsiella ginkgonis]MXV14258.1 DUF1801 domain-containing protein [Hufsiella ginkgonis]
MLKPADFEDYKRNFSPEIQDVLNKARAIIKEAAPGAEEVISYGMPAFKQDGMLVYFAAAKKHLGFYPMPAAITKFEEELAGYVTSKGAIQFPYTKPVPAQLIAKIVKFRIAENQAKAGAKKK